MCGCSGGGACVVALGGGSMRGCSGGACMVARGGMHGCSGGVCVAPLGGGVHGCTGGVRGFFHEIRSMSGRYASYWNAFLFSKSFQLNLSGVMHQLPRRLQLSREFLMTWDENFLLGGFQCRRCRKYAKSGSNKRRSV